MYDISGETDRTILLQSALLLGFYHSEKDLHTQPWYWSGVAISLCQIIGLHRTPVPTDANSAGDAQRRRMARRLWWCCFYRDCWLSLTLGRPRRIDLDDCDVSMPEESDLLQDIVGLANELQNVCTEADRLHLAKDWVVLIQLSKLLSEVFTWKTRSKSRQPVALQQAQDLEAAMAKFTFDPSECRDSRIAAFSLHHLRLHNQYVNITEFLLCDCKYSQRAERSAPRSIDPFPKTPSKSSHQTNATHGWSTCEQEPTPPLSKRI